MKNAQNCLTNFYKNLFLKLSERYRRYLRAVYTGTDCILWYHHEIWKTGKFKRRWSQVQVFLFQLQLARERNEWWTGWWRKIEFSQRCLTRATQMIFYFIKKHSGITNDSGYKDLDNWRSLFKRAIVHWYWWWRCWCYANQRVSQIFGTNDQLLHELTRE